MITKLERAVQGEELAWDRKAYKQFHSEMEAYHMPDDKLVQDSVMTAAQALAWYTDPKRKKRKKARARVFTA
jgi:alpha-acetolactate decarboxylase